MTTTTAKAEHTGLPDLTGKRILVTGASGYVGSLLIERLRQTGATLRAGGRHPSELDGDLPDDIEVVELDVAKDDQLAAALDGVDIAYYLLHSMEGGGDFVTRDRHLAQSFAAAAKKAELSRIVYLSGLHPPQAELSPHLGSRVEVGEILLDSGVPTAVLQAGVVLGDGSASFDMLRYLTERLPAVVAPKWLRNRIQPIAVDDALHYLVQAATLDPEYNRTFDIGSPDVLTYTEMMKGYARVTKIGRRHIKTLPVLTPGLASHWVGLVTPVDANVAKPLVGSLIHEAICHEDDLSRLVGRPPGGKTSFDGAILAAATDYEPVGWDKQVYASAAVLAAGVIGYVAWRVKRKASV